MDSGEKAEWDLRAAKPPANPSSAPSLSPLRGERGQKE